MFVGFSIHFPADGIGFSEAAVGVSLQMLQCLLVLYQWQQSFFESHPDLLRPNFLKILWVADYFS
jgi:hypothetical protein